MRRTKSLMSLVLGVMLLLTTSAFAEPVKLILDTDMGNDVDDALALAMIHSLENRGECELLAVTITKDHPETAPYVDAINTFYGRGEIPIGIVKGGVTPERSRFTGVTLEKQDDSYVFPHDLVLGQPVRDATELLRQVLATQPDLSVVIAQIGFSTNLTRLLESGKDAHSELNGAELVAKKVKAISIMAGAFAPIGGKTHLEYNVVQDIPAAQALAKKWPTPIIWSGFEIGLALPYPATSIERDFVYRERHPIPESYQAYIPTPHERPTWDLTSVLHAVRPDREYFELSSPGTVTVHDNGETTFAQTEKGKHVFLKLRSERVLQVQEILAALTSEPPKAN